ncbi:DUF5719 family protein [Tessaracoccus sp.]
MRRNLLTLLLLVVAVAVGLALTFLPATPLPRTLEVVPPVSSKLVCAPLVQPGDLFVDGADTISPLGQDPAMVTGATVLTGQVTPSVISGGSELMGGMLVTDVARAAFVPCATPRSQGTILVPASAGTDLLVVNPDASEAIVDLTLYGPDGEIVALGARGIAVAPHSSRVIALSVLAPDVGPVGVEYRASRGRVTVVARTDTPSALDAATASAPGTQHWLPGIPQGATSATVLLSNPGTGRAVVEITAQGTSLAYQPEGGTGVSVPPRSTIAVALAASLAGEATGLSITSDVDVAVGLSTGAEGDPALSTPVVAARELGAFTSGAGVVQLSNPGDAAATATLTVDVIDGESSTSDLTIAPGATSVVALGAGTAAGHRISVTSDRELFGAVVLSDAGVAIVPLTSTEVVPVPPVDAEIVPTLR